MPVAAVAGAAACAVPEAVVAAVTLVECEVVPELAAGGSVGFALELFTPDELAAEVVTLAPVAVDAACPVAAAEPLGSPE